MSMRDIRRMYGVPAKRGARVEFSMRAGSFHGHADVVIYGVILYSKNGYLRVRLDGQPDVLTVHSSHTLAYLPTLSSIEVNF